MNVIPLDIPDVILITPKVFADERGFFLESWNSKYFSEIGINVSFVQDNHSRSVRGTLRGLHYQIDNTQGKLVRVTRGEVFDVAVDLRRSSPTFGRWVGALLTDSNNAILWVPPGFAHGFYVISEQADFLYKCTDFYAARHERCIRWDDPDLAIEWPIPEGAAPLVSAKDAEGLLFREAPAFP